MQANRGRGRGSRSRKRFTGRGSWRTPAQQYDEEPLVWLPPAGVPTPTPLTQHTKAPGGGSRRKEEYHFTELGAQFWGQGQETLFKAEMITSVYSTLKKTKFAVRAVMGLEFSQYLENYLWPHFTAERCTPAYLMSVVLMVNEKWRERVPPWMAFTAHPLHFQGFFQELLIALTLESKETPYSVKERCLMVQFLIHCCNSLEIDVVREQVQRLVSLGIWEHLPSTLVDEALKQTPKLKKYWTVLHKRDKQANAQTRERTQTERVFLWKLIHSYFQVLDSTPAEGALDEDSVSFCERCLELLIDLEAQLPTRRFFNTLLASSHLVVRSSLSVLHRRDPEGQLFKQLLTRLRLYTGFEIDDQTGGALTDHQMTDQHYSRITSLQRAAFKLFPALRAFALGNVASVDSRKALSQHFSTVDEATLQEIAEYLNLAPPVNPDPRLLREILVSYHERRPSQLEAINDLPLYPTEEILWDETIVPSEFYDGDTCLALPKLNLQFLTLHDYLLRNFELFRLESTYEIREDLEDVVTRLKPWVTPEGDTQFAGWARMALHIGSFSVVEVGQPKVGENRPSRVRADITVDLNVADRVKNEWESLRKHDVCFLLTVRAKMSIDEGFDASAPFVSQVGLEYVRGCEMEGMLDEAGKVIEEGPEPRPRLEGKKRVYRVWLDTNQYQSDMGRLVEGAEDVYETFNVFVRRKPKENNFKAVLETIRDLMNTNCLVPDWIHDTFLGYGDPASANYTNLTNQVTELNFNDTFLSVQHVKDSFPSMSVEVVGEEAPVPPFILEFPTPVVKVGKKRSRAAKSAESSVIQVKPYTIPNRGPYPYNVPKKNTVPFTPTQVEAIRSGMQPGLTMVVGPPGTGKTDVAVQIISNLYHNFPDQRTLLVTHSNQALNQLFEKIMCLDIDERHLLRLGHGEESLATDKDFSRYGRVNFILALRLDLLREVERLQNSLGVSGDVAYTCETAGHFFLYQVLARWEKYTTKLKPLTEKEEGVAAIAGEFPFTKYFSNAPQPLFNGRSFAEDWDIAEGCFRHIKKIFKQLEEFRAFELLRSGRDRINYLLVREAKIIAMTCTHAALKRKDLVDLAFKYDNVLMEESAQILEVETFVPLMLQNPQDGYSRLKRVILIGDHHQLPPVIKNMAFQKFSNMEQSLFARFVRLGVPTIQLDAQGRARPSLCSLYQWRYAQLDNLPHVLASPEYQVANPGFRFDYQLIDVGDFNGVGESAPTPHFYQNLAEAEYVVSLFMYMRLLGYPPHKITILTTYNGQKHLIRDVLAKRCASNPVFGMPDKVTTVDRYQGQQNDYIILSLVRTKHVGHLRDVRRLVVAMSRARLGLYVFARVGLFNTCTELQPAFRLLLNRPTQLHLMPSETCPTERRAEEHVDMSQVFVVAEMQQMAHFVYQDYSMRLEALRQQNQQREAEELEERLIKEAADKANAESVSEDTAKDGATPTQDMTIDATPTVVDNTSPAPGAMEDEGSATPTQDASTDDTTTTQDMTDDATPTSTDDTPTQESTSDTPITVTAVDTPTPDEASEDTPTQEENHMDID
ncbi:RNA helicase aquarius-like isoform X4 [Halichondria panicea]|uniref:RNA helicase aquarius-like isoform X4 n=1 Tax=Halichondria panicea TaxID=6063 RepID=UPI00312BB5F8